MEVLVLYSTCILSIIALLLWVLASIFEKADHNKSKKPGSGRWTRIAPNTQIVRETILFCGGILSESGIQYYPAFTIRYYNHKKFAGIFNGEVVVYLKSNPDMESLVNTTLHEVRHYMQSLTDKQYKRYDDLTRDYGQWKNPLEVDARDFAARHQQAALKHLESKKLIKRT